MKLLLFACLALPLAGCSASDPASPATEGGVAAVPDLVDLDQLNQRLRPTGGERALLVNFWATW